MPSLTFYSGWDANKALTDKGKHENEYVCLHKLYFFAAVEQILLFVPFKHPLLISVQLWACGWGQDKSFRPSIEWSNHIYYGSHFYVEVKQVLISRVGSAASPLQPCDISLTPVGAHVGYKGKKNTTCLCKILGNSQTPAIRNLLFSFKKYLIINRSAKLKKASWKFIINFVIAFLSYW